MSTPLPNPFLDLIPENNDDFSPGLMEFLARNDDPPPLFLSQPSKEYLDSLWDQMEKIEIEDNMQNSAFRAVL